MYPNYLQDRRLLGYKTIMDTKCGSQLLLITDSTFLFVNNIRLNGKRKIVVMIGVMIFTFSVPEFAVAMGSSQITLNTPEMIFTNRDLNRVLKPSMDYLDIEPKIIMPSSVTLKSKSDLKNPKWLSQFLYTLRGGDNEELIKCIISKVSESDWDVPSINKFLKNLIEISLKYGTNDKLLRILAELQKPLPQSSIVVEAWPNPLIVFSRTKPVDRGVFKDHKLCTPSIEALLDRTKCYAHREAYNMPRSVSERFETKSVEKLVRNCLKNPRLKKEYASLKKQLTEGVHPVNIGDKSTYVSSDKVLVKKGEGRYLIEISDLSAEIVGLSPRSNDKLMAKFEKLMNELYNINLKGY